MRKQTWAHLSPLVAGLSHMGLTGVGWLTPSPKEGYAQSWVSARHLSPGGRGQFCTLTYTFCPQHPVCVQERSLTLGAVSALVLNQ
jgi:hypothetical protein